MMKKTTYKITKMDCASEEQLLRMKLSGIRQIEYLDFDITGRKLEVFHRGESSEITAAIDKLQLGSSVIASEDEAVELPIAADDAAQRKLLWQVLLINLILFFVEMSTGFISHSMGLVADSLDMLADALVYGLALLAVGGSALRKARVARFSGYLQLLLAIVGFAEVIRRFLGYSDFPVFSTMIIISLIALAGNAYCLYLLRKAKSSDTHIRASMIFTSNDVIINLGVVAAGVLVFWTNSKAPDLIVGILVFAIVARGALRILQIK